MTPSYEADVEAVLSRVAKRAAWTAADVQALRQVLVAPQRAAADIGNNEAWDRFYRAQAECAALRELLGRASREMFGEHPARFLSCWDRDDWRHRMVRAAAGESAILRGHARALRQPLAPGPATGKGQAS